MTTGVVVLGMHRSGTSATARVINLLGVPINVEHDWLPVTTDNPRGYWESAALVDFNNSLLARLGCSSVSPPPLGTDWSDEKTFEPFSTRAEHVFRSVFPTPTWIWKDPRTCLTLPFWRRVLTEDLVAVVVYRNPLEVARSLVHRDHMTSSHALALWERYVRASLCNARGLPTLVLSYADIVANPMTGIETLTTFLTMYGFQVQPNNHESAAATLDCGLRHQVSTSSALGQSTRVSLQQKHLFRCLQRLRGVHACFATPRLLSETPWTKDLLELQRLLEQSTAKARADVQLLESGKRWLDEQRISWQNTAQARDAEIQQLRARIHLLEAYKQDLERQVSFAGQVTREHDMDVERVGD